MFEKINQQLKLYKELFKTGFYAGAMAKNMSNKQGVKFIKETVDAKAKTLSKTK